MAKLISQREARRLRKRVTILEDIIERQRRDYSQDWFGGVDIGRYEFTTVAIPEIVRTARRLGHAVVAVGDDTDTIRFIALPHPKVSA
jgi:hypothetical protein